MRKKLMWFMALAAVVSLTAMTGVASAAVTVAGAV